jgi:hypothetical protein
MLNANMIDSNLEEKLKKIEDGKEMAVILSSKKEVVHGYYSTKKPMIPTVISEIRYKDKYYPATQIARIISENNYDSNLKELDLVPYSIFSSSYPNEQGLEFKLLIVGNVNAQDVKELLEDKWEMGAKTSLNLELDKQVGSIF